MTFIVKFYKAERIPIEDSQHIHFFLSSASLNSCKRFEDGLPNLFAFCQSAKIAINWISKLYPTGWVISARATESKFIIMMGRAGSLLRNPASSFCLFSPFSNKQYNFTTSIRCRDSNPQPSEHESPPITTRPRLLQNNLLFETSSRFQTRKESTRFLDATKMRCFFARSLKLFLKWLFPTEMSFLTVFDMRRHSKHETIILISFQKKLRKWLARPQMVRYALSQNRTPEKSFSDEIFNVSGCCFKWADIGYFIEPNMSSKTVSKFRGFKTAFSVLVTFEDSAVTRG